jgi:hypothetical protein
MSLKVGMQVPRGLDTEMSEANPFPQGKFMLPQNRSGTVILASNFQII